jgi:hypothetical protein
MKKLLAAAAAVLLSAGLVNADISGPFADSIGISKTNWSHSVELPKFDPSLGTLVAVHLKLSGHVEGSAQFESGDSDPAHVIMDLEATIKLTRPDLSTLGVVIPAAHTADDVTEDDGVFDYGGTSGKSYFDLTGDDTNFIDSPPPAADLTLFTATFLGETISLPVSAEGTSKGSGAGNLDVKFRAAASADVEVYYEYTSGVPLPAAAWGGLTLLGGLAANRIRRARKA